MSPNISERTKAEEQLLKNFKGKPGYGLLILQVVHRDTVPLHSRHAAATLFKNYVKQCWENGTITDGEKDEIRKILPPFMLSVPQTFQKLISASLNIISEVDYPRNWPNLLPGLVEQLKSATDFRVIMGILKVINSIFKRYRHQLNSDEVLTEIKYSLEQFYTPLVELFKNSVTQFEAHKTNPDALLQLFTALKSIANIFYSLNSVDIPEQFEDNLAIWFPSFQKFIEFETNLPVLIDADQDDSPGLLHKVQASVISNGSLYMDKYDEEFKPYLPAFVSAVWKLLMKTPNEPKYDALVTCAINFLNSVCRSPCYVLFQNPQVLSDICKLVVVPNINIRKSDLFLFEDDPIEYVRKDMEGSDIGTRRRSAFELVKALRKNFENEVTQIFAKHINELLVEYTKDVNKFWTNKDAAIYLITSLAVTRASVNGGVTGINESVPIKDFYKSQIIPELLSDACPQPLLKASCLSFINSFRRQFSSSDFNEMVPFLNRYLLSNNFVVSSYAAICFERFLMVKDKTSTGFSFRFGSQVLSPHLRSILQSLLSALKPDDKSENPYVMTATTRVLTLCKDELLPYAETIFGALVKKLDKIYRSPTTPEFGYHLFEAIAVTITVLCRPSLASLEMIEKFLLPIFSVIITDPTADVFSPFAFQTMAYLLELRPNHLPDHYRSLLPEITVPNWWQQQGNVPALTRLLQAYISSGSDYIVSSKQLFPILGIYQKLLSTKVNDFLGFYLLQSIVLSLPMSEVVPLLPEIFKIIFMRIQSKKTTQVVKGFIVFLSTFISKHDAKLVLDGMSTLQANIFLMVLQSLWIPNVESINGRLERKTLAISMVKLLCLSREMIEPPYVDLWPTLFAKLIHLFEGLEGDTKATEEDISHPEDETAQNYSTGFSTLRNAPKHEVDYFQSIDPKKLLLTSLNASTKTNPKYISLLKTIPQEYQQALRTYSQTTGIPLVF
uniref:Importin N-terminal domain-containing protein n=1 Tax=Arcella intermedia TaxID=1963864 RepID=A0A6B2KX00_9EUKA